MEEEKSKQEKVRDSFLVSVMDKLAAELPVIFTRKEIEKLLGGTISAGTLANLGKNGPNYVIFSNKAVYEKSSFLEWLTTQLKSKQ